MAAPVAIAAFLISHPRVERAYCVVRAASRPLVKEAIACA
jgi:hypothetical protein